MTKTTKSSTEDLDDQIADMRARLGVSNDHELAQILDLSPSSVSAWRRRGSVPKKYTKQIDRFLSIPKVAAPEFVKRRIAYGYGLLAYAATVLHAHFGSVDGLNHFVWYGFRLERLHHYIQARLATVEIGNSEALKREFESVKSDINRTDLAEWIDASS
jgi:hypothetical protein